MLKIGEFARLCNVSVKTLRFYDRQRLLPAAEVDDASGYRYYTLEQVPRLHRILALKALGFPLERVGRMLDDEISTEEMRAMLRRQGASVRRQVVEAQQRLALIEFRLRMIDAESDFPDLDVVIKPLEPLRVLTMYNGPFASRREAMAAMERVSRGINRAIADGTIRFAGSVFDVFHGETILPFESPGLGDRQHEIWLAVTRAQEAVALDGVGDWEVRDEPGVAAAATLVLTPDGGDLQGYEKVALLRRWAVGRGYRPGDHVRHLALRGPLQTLDPAEFIVEAQLPLDPSRA